MKRFVFLGCVALFFYLIEFFLFNIFGKFFLPNLLLLLIIFTSLYGDKYHGFYLAIFSGFIKDAFSINYFGLNIAAFLGCAIFIFILKKYIYHELSRLFLILIIISVCMFNFLIQYTLRSMFGNVNFIVALKNVFFPEALMTLFLATPTLKQLRKCVLKSSV